MSLTSEKEAFGKRLTGLLNGAGIGIASPTHVAHEFNRRYVGKSVTAQAVRNWINGEAMPTADKIRVLAKWLKVSPHWLHYGEGEITTSVLTLQKEEQSADEVDDFITLPEDFQRLSPKHKMMVCEIVHALLKAEKR